VKRRTYDATGHEDAAAAAAAGAARGGFGGGMQRGGGGLFREDMDAEDLFRMFFGGNPFMAGATHMYSFGGGTFPSSARQRAAQQQQQQRQGGGGGGGGQPAEASPMRTLLSLAPFILLLLLNLMAKPSRPVRAAPPRINARPPAATPPNPSRRCRSPSQTSCVLFLPSFAAQVFSLSQTRQHPLPQATAAHGVPYWVEAASSFEGRYPPGSRERSRLELQVESEWREATQRQCYNERLLRHRYEYYGRAEQAAAVELKACKELARRFSPGGAGGEAAAGADPAAAAAA
jgi:hypothetical protein